MDLNIIQQQLPVDSSRGSGAGTSTFQQINANIIKVGAAPDLVYIDETGVYCGGSTSDLALAYLKSDGTVKYKTASGDTIMDTGSLTGDYLNVINNALNTSSKQILSDFTFTSSDYSGAFRTGNITWDEVTGLVTGGTGSVYNAAGLIFAKDGVPTITLNGITGDATFAGDITGATGTFTGNILIGPVGTSQVGIDAYTGEIRFYYGGSDYANISVNETLDLIYVAHDFHQFFTGDGTQIAVFKNSSTDNLQLIIGGITMPLNAPLKWGTTTLTGTGYSVNVNGDVRIPSTSGFYCGTRGGQNGTFKDQGGSTITVRGGIIVAGL